MLSTIDETTEEQPLPDTAPATVALGPEALFFSTTDSAPVTLDTAMLREQLTRIERAAAAGY